MDHVSVFDAKKRLSALLDQVERGREVIITRRGTPIAWLVPASAFESASAGVVGLKVLRSSIAERGATLQWSELMTYRDEGRR